MTATLKFVKAIPKKVRAKPAIDPQEHARKKFLEGVGHQIKLAENPDYTIEKVTYKGGERQTKKAPPRAWFQTDGNTTYIQIRYGNKPLQLKGGSIAVTTPSELVATLKLIHKEGESGKWDTALVKTATRDKGKTATA